MNRINDEPESNEGTVSRIERACRIALSQLPKVGPVRLRWLLDDRSAEETFAGLVSGTMPGRSATAPAGVNVAMVEQWRLAARTTDPEVLLDRHLDAGLHVLVPGDRLWPFVDDPEPPLVLYAWGNPSLLHAQEGPAQQRVAIVGTRRCTDIGRGFANELGFELAGAGIAVVSGLALGIDGAVHTGALRAAGPGAGSVIAVVANGLDRISPRFHRVLSESVAEQGVVLSEWPLGTSGDRWRFPARNRLIAGLSKIVVVVESHARGGALITVDEAIERGVTVMAVPGSVRSAASAGTNRLLGEGVAPVCSAADVLAELGLNTAPSTARSQTPPGHATSPLPGLFDRAVVGRDPLEQLVLDQLGTGPRSIDNLVALTERSLPDLILAVQRLVSSGSVVQVGSTVSLSEPTSWSRRPGSGDASSARR